MSILAVEPGTKCPRCERRVPIPREDKTPRKRGQVNISVPADAEDGAEILRELIAACRDKLGPQMGWDSDVPPYYVLTASLAALLHDLA